MLSAYQKSEKGFGEYIIRRIGEAKDAPLNDRVRALEELLLAAAEIIIERADEPIAGFEG